jgi:hypothetical protein
MTRLAAKFVPRVLTEQQKYKRVNVARDLQDELKNDLQSHRSNGR